ncbi:MAG: bacterial transcriptional activator domain-containing protein [Desulfuromonadaceae bacterium]|nr:bacterial transcriptional activator domain-containing protein [Desulfuromonadaceae bacterium]
MVTPDIKIHIQTLGRFSISIAGNPVATEWPNEMVKVFFCSLLSPLDLYFTWDRVCRSMLSVPVSRASRHRLDELIIRPLINFLVKEIGFNPLVAVKEGIHIDQKHIHVDAHEFYATVLEGIKLLSEADNAAALEKFGRADALYTGSYLPGIMGKIIENARHDLDSLYLTAVMEGVWQARSTRQANTPLFHPPQKKTMTS